MADYKTFGTNLEDSEHDEKIKAVVIRDQATGMIAGHMCETKGPGDKWVVNKIIEDIADWGYTDIILKTDGEPAILAL